MNYQVPSTGEKLSNKKFVTLTQADPEFRRLMNGAGPAGYRAIPLESFAVNSKSERVTFALMPEEAIDRPSLWILLTKLMRLELLSVTMGSCWLAFLVFWRQGYQADLNWLWVLMAIFGFHVASFAFDDFHDHWHGVDRLQRERGSQVIQRGWLKARTVWWIGLVALLTSTIVGSLLLFVQPTLTVLMAIIAIGAVVGFSFAGRGFKSQGVGDFVIGLCLGPLMVFGMGQLLVPQLTLPLLLLGLPLGLAAIILFQMRQLESIMAERRVKTGTMVARLGFDRAKKYLSWEMNFLPALVALALWYWHGWPISLLALAIVIVGLWPLRKKLKDSVSPMSSHLLGLSRLALRQHLFLFMLLSLGILL